MAKQVFEFMDENSDGYLEPEEIKCFIQAMNSLSVRKMAPMFDHIQDKIYKDLALGEVLKGLNEKADKEVLMFLNSTDTNHDGKITFEEYVGYYLNKAQKRADDNLRNPESSKD